MKIFVTGASGFVGGEIARTLSREHSVEAMSRSEASDAAVRATGAIPVRCELGEVEVGQLAGCQAVVHCAAYVGQWGPRERYWQVNVAGTEQLLETARAAGVATFLYLGTEAALFRGQELDEIDESYPYPASTPFPYAESKAAAERRVLAANQPDFRTISVRPRLVWGPGDQTILPVLVEMVKAGQFVWLDGGRKRTSTTHVANVAHGVRLALERGRGGEVYFITDGPPISFRRFFTALLATRGLTPPARSLPGWLGRSLAFLLEGVWRLLRLESEPPLTRLGAALLSRECTIRIDKARRELGYEPVIRRQEGIEQLKGAV